MNGTAPVLGYKPWQSPQQAAALQARSDQEFYGRATRYAQELTALRDKLALYPKGSVKYDETFNEMQDSIHALRDLYHPDKNPNAIAKFGHILTDALHITNPRQRIQKTAAQRAAGIANDEQEARGIVEATPGRDWVEPELANRWYDFRSNYKMITGHEPPPDVAEQFARTGQAVEPKETPEKYYPQLATTKDATGQDHYWRVPLKQGAPPEEVDFNGQTMVPKNVKPMRGTLVRSKQSPTGFAQTWVDPYHPSQIVGWQPVTPSRYYQGTTSAEMSTDPFGVTTTSSRVTQPLNQQNVDLSGAIQYPGTPEEPSAEPGQPDGGQPAALATPGPAAKPSPMRRQPSAASGAPTPSAARPGAVPPKSLAELRKEAAARASQPGGAQLDAQGHIPASPQLNEGLRSAANQLLDGMDLEKLPLPTRDKQAAAALAARYGWGQGLFTPKEKLLLREAKTYLMQALSDPALKVLDNRVSRAKLANAIHAAKGDAGFWSSAFALNLGLNSQEAEFLRMYNQLLGTVSGLGQLTRSGRITEATIQRLMYELPNPLQSQSAADAKARINRLLSEITVAEQTGNFPVPSGGGAGAQPSGTARDFLRNFRGGSAPPPQTIGAGGPR